MMKKYCFLVSAIVLLVSGCNEPYTPVPNQVAFAQDTWNAQGQFPDGEDWIPVYQLGTTNSDVDNYIRFHTNQELTTALEHTHFEYITRDSCLIGKNKYIGYIKIKPLPFSTANSEYPRLTLVLDGNKDISPKTGMHICYVYIYPAKD